MSTTYQALKRLAQKLMGSKGHNEATGGNTTTLIDTTLINPEPDDWWNGGTIFVDSGSANAPCSDEITDWNATTKTWTLRTTHGASFAAGDEYTVYPDTYPLPILYSALNAALLELAAIDKVYNNASYVTVANQQAYDFPTDGWIVKKVEIATSKSAPYGWKTYYGWKAINDGTDDQIVFNAGAQPTEAGYLIQLTYELYPDEVNDDDDVIHEWYDLDWVAWEAAKIAATWKMEREQGQNPYTLAKIAEAEQKAQFYRAKHKKHLPRTGHEPELGGWATIKI